MQRQKSGQVESARMEEHLAKYPALMLKLSLIFHCAEHAINKAIPAQVDELTACRAIAWCEYLEYHAEQMYADQHNGPGQVTKTALALLTKIKEAKLISGTTISQVLRKSWSGLKDEKLVTAATALLQENGWIRLTQKNTNGRPTAVIEINPNALQYLQVKEQFVTEEQADAPLTPWLDQLKEMLNPHQPIIDWMMALHDWSDINDLDDDTDLDDDHEHEKMREEALQISAFLSS